MGITFSVLKDVLPIMGIVAFSGCSVNAVANLFLDRAKHGTPLFWAAAVLVELTTAWLVWSVVETTRKITKSNISKQDKRFHSIILAVFLVLAIPSLSVSVVANVIEFGGDILLGLLFPTLSVACAVGAGLPQTVKRHESQKQADVKDKGAKREAKAKERQEAERKQAQEAEAAKKRATCGVCHRELGEAALKDGKCADCRRSAEGKTHSLPFDISLAVLERDGWQCYHCGGGLRDVPAGKRHIDHFVPKSKGGEDVVENLVTSCQFCNLKKHDRLPDEREQWRFSQYLRATAAGADKRAQILELASSKEGQTALKQKVIAEILRTSPGWVSTVIKEDNKLRLVPQSMEVAR